MTNREELNLENELKNSKYYRKKQFKNLFLSIIIGNSIAGIVVYLNNGSRNGKLFIGILAVILVMLIPVGIGYILSQKILKRLSSDLENGKKFKENQL